MLRFERDPVYFERWLTQHSGATYLIEFRYGGVSIMTAHAEDALWDTPDEVFAQEIGGRDVWTDKQVNVYLTRISAAIESGALESLELARMEDVRDDPAYCYGPYPSHPVGLSCGHLENPPPPEGNMNRHVRKARELAGIHDHEVGCQVWVPADAIDPWIREHPAEHAAYTRLYPVAWTETLRRRQ